MKADVLGLSGDLSILSRPGYTTEEEEDVKVWSRSPPKDEIADIQRSSLKGKTVSKGVREVFDEFQ